MAPIALAAKAGDACLCALLQYGGAPEARSHSGATPVHYGAERGHAGVVGLLLTTYADFPRYADDGATPLDVARQLRHAEIIDLLLRAERQRTGDDDKD